jgi:acylpyruvate hydrolase
MKIVAVGRNYAEHIAELNNEKPENPVIFSKPETALLRNNEPFYYPSFSNDVHHEVEIVLKISKMGKNIEEKFAHKYYEEIALGIDFTARDIQSNLKAKGLPWDLAKGFNDSAPISNFISKNGLNLANLNFSLDKNGVRQQTGNTSMMLYSFDYLISFISKYFTLKTGDLIFTGTPSGVSPVQIGDRLIGKIEDNIMFDFEVK